MKRLEKSLDSPEIFPSKILSKKIGRGIKIDIMDFSQTRTGSHKGIKARHGLDYVNKKGGDYALIITSGNAGHAFDIVSRDDGYDIQVVKFVNKNVMRKPINITNLGQDRSGKDKYGITIRLPKGWFTPKKLERFWKRLIQEKKKEYRDNKEFGNLLNIINGNGLNPLNAFDVTNIRNYDKKGKSPYSSIPEIKHAVREYDYIFSSLGSAEFFAGWQEAANRLWFSKPVLVAVTSYENPVSLAQQKKSVNGVRLRKKHRKSHADKLDTPKIGDEHRRSVAMADERTYFCSLPDRLIDKAYKSMGLVRREHPDLRTTPTGSICLGVLNKEYVEYLDRGIRVMGTYGFDVKCNEICKKELVMKPLIIKPRSKVLIVNTGGLN